MSSRKIRLELLPHERAALLRWTMNIEVHDQLAARPDQDVVTISLSEVDVHWVAGDLTHAIVKLGCREETVFDLSERLDYVDDTGDGSLAAWY